MDTFCGTSDQASRENFSAFAKSSTFTAPVSTYNFQTLKFSGTLDAVEGEAAREINEPSVMQTERGFSDNWQEAGSN